MSRDALARLAALKAGRAVPVGDLGDEIAGLVEAARVQTEEPYVLADIPDSSAVELARLLLESAGLPPDVCDALLRHAESVEGVLALLRGIVRVERRPGLPVGEKGPTTEPVRWPVEEGPGAGDLVRLEVLVMRGTQRSTVVVVDERTGRAVSRQVVQHGTEAAEAGRAVQEAVAARRP